MVEIKLDVDVALEQFVERYLENQGKQVDNSSFPAGAPIIYYCRHCGVHTQTLPESHWGRPKVVCDPCEVLVAHGLIPKGIKMAKEKEAS